MRRDAGARERRRKTGIRSIHFTYPAELVRTR